MHMWKRYVTKWTEQCEKDNLLVSGVVPTGYPYEKNEI